MSRLCVIGAKDAGNCTVDLQFSDQTTRRVDIGDFILGAFGGGKKFIGTFIDANGNAYDVYR